VRAIDSLAPAGRPAAGRAAPTGAARPVATALEVELGHATKPGPRPANEDFVAAAMPEGAERAAKGVLLAIADGVGGHAHGREAAEYTVRSLLADYFSTAHTWSVEKSLDTVLGAANRWLLAQSARTAETAGMATTLTALVLRGRRWHLAHVGDSRAYLWRDGALLRLSEDHTWPHPELSNVLRRAVGLELRLLVDHDDGELAAGDVFVLLTDGVWNALGDEAISALLARRAGEARGRGAGGAEGGWTEVGGTAAGGMSAAGIEAGGTEARRSAAWRTEAEVTEAGLDPQAAADALVEAALRAGGNDNASALVARVCALPADNLHDRLAAGRRLPLPPRLAEGDTLDGLRVEAVLHVSRLTVLYRVCPATVPVGAPAGANAAVVPVDHDASCAAAFAASAAPTSPGTVTASPGTATASPRTATTSPATATTSPGTATASPRTATTSPRTATTSPATATTSPGTATTSPGTATTSPGTATASPANRDEHRPQPRRFL
jgi:serine/threonine protein phosphatase PrpC